MYDPWYLDHPTRLLERMRDTRQLRWHLWMLLPALSLCPPFHPYERDPWHCQARRLSSAQLVAITRLLHGTYQLADGVYPHDERLMHLGAIVPFAVHAFATVGQEAHMVASGEWEELFELRQIVIRDCLIHADLAAMTGVHAT